MCMLVGNLGIDFYFELEIEETRGLTCHVMHIHSSTHPHLISLLDYSMVNALQLNCLCLLAMEYCRLHYKIAVPFRNDSFILLI